MRFGANAPVILGYCDWLILVVLPACHDNYRSYGSVGTPTLREWQWIYMLIYSHKTCHLNLRFLSVKII